jgi:hypothetical protein
MTIEGTPTHPEATGYRNAEEYLSLADAAITAGRTEEAQTYATLAMVVIQLRQMSIAEGAVGMSREAIGAMMKELGEEWPSRDEE